MDRDVYDFYKSAGSALGTLTVPKLVRLAAEIISPAAQMLLFAWLEATRKNIVRSRHFLKMAEQACQDEMERCYVQHLGAMVLSSMGDTQMAIEMDRKCLEPSSRLGCDWLRTDVLSHLSALFGMLGHQDLATAFAGEATAEDPEWLSSVVDRGEA